MTANLLGSDVV